MILKKDHFLFKPQKKNYSIFVSAMIFNLMGKNIKGTFLTISQTDSFEIYCDRKSSIFEVISPSTLHIERILKPHFFIHF